MRELELQKAQQALAAQQLAAKSSGSRSSSSKSSSSKTSSSLANAQALVKAALSQQESDVYKKMAAASPKANPKAKTGITSQPGSYWYARGYGSAYLPK
jgi:hypothetical protein